MKIMSIDVSTTTIGLAVLETNDGYTELKHIEYYKPNKKLGLFIMLRDVKNFVVDRLNKFNPGHVVIEDIIQFMQGASGAKTIIALAVINRTVGLTVFEATGKEPCLLNVMKIRHSLKLTKVLPKKEEMPELVAQLLNIKFPWKYDKKGNIAAESYDMADAIAVGLSFVKVEKNGQVVQKKKKSKKKKVK